jgi:DNA-binding NarL/FixJ family response regulator
MSLLNQKTKILLVDDHQLFNDGLKSLLTSDENIEIVGQQYDGRNILHEIHKNSPDIIFLDINLPNQNGMELGKIILQNFSQVKIIFLTMYAEQALFKEAQKIGASGYILKNAGLKDLLNAIASVMDGKTFFDVRLEKQTKTQVKDGFEKKLSLTDREIEIIRYIRDGLDSYQIADKTNLTYLTVKTHRRNIHFKLGTDSTAELIRFANDNNL